VRLFDTSVLIDAREDDSPWHQWAKEQIAEAVSSDGAAANTVVVSEASVRAKDPAAVPALLEGFGVTLVLLPVSAAVPAARAFSVYLDRVKRLGRLAACVHRPEAAVSIPSRGLTVDLWL